MYVGYCRQNLYEAKKMQKMRANHPICPICPQSSHLKRVRKCFQKWSETTKEEHPNINSNFMRKENEKFKLKNIASLQLKTIIWQYH